MYPRYTLENTQTTPPTNAHRQELIAQGVNVQSLLAGEVVINV